MNNRQTMWDSNRRAKIWLIENGYDHIWFKRHTKRKDRIFRKDGTTYLATDLFNLFDGLCISPHGMIIFFQVKTNAWASENQIKEFFKDKIMPFVMLVNVEKKKGRKTVRTRMVS